LRAEFLVLKAGVVWLLVKRIWSWQSSELCKPLAWSHDIYAQCLTYYPTFYLLFVFIDKVLYVVSMPA